MDEKGDSAAEMFTHRNLRLHLSSGFNRRGVAAVELAVTLPVLVFMTLAAIQATTMIQLRHSAMFLVDELLRQATQTDISDTDLRVTGANIAQEVQLHGVTFDVVRLPVDSMIRIEAHLPVASNYSGPIVIPAGTLNVIRTGYKDHP